MPGRKHIMVNETPEFHLVGSDLTRLVEAIRGDGGDRLAMVRSFLTERFTRITGRTLNVMPVHALTGSGEPVPEPVVCADCPEEGHRCLCSWPQHIEALRSDGATHWHHTECGRYCALVPLMRDDERIHAVRLVCDGDIAEQIWLDNLDFLSLLRETFHLPTPTSQAVEQARSAPPATPVEFDTHPLVARAIALIEQRLADPHLSVTSIAATLNVNATYLSHVFSTNVGRRMVRFINERRVARAKHLLITTDASVKRISFDCGFTSASWFGERFRTYTGVTPGQYRAQAAKEQAGALIADVAAPKNR